MRRQLANLLAPPVRIPFCLAVVTVLGQIVWVLVPAELRTVTTVFTVSTFFLASAGHALVRRGAAWTGGFLAITLLLGLGIEAVGTATGLPFGDYEYTDLLGPRVLSVPWLIPLAWSMMAYPCLLAAQRLSRHPVWTPLVGGWLFAAWDIFLDPQMVGEGYWVWRRVDAALPGIPEIPLQNFAGWFAIASLMMALLDRLPRRAAGEEVPVLLLSWTFLSNVLAAGVFFGRPAVAAWGGAAMGLVIIPWWRRLQGR